MEIAIFLAVIGVCLFAAFTSLHHATMDVVTMGEYHADTRALRERDASRLDYAYLGRPGGYLSIDQLALSVAAAQYDKSAPIRLFDVQFEAHDMRVLNALDMADVGAEAYDLVNAWYAGFRQSPECTEVAGRIYEYSSADNGVNKFRTFKYDRINQDVSGFIYSNPNPGAVDNGLRECRFKLQLVDITNELKPKTEYRLFIFLGSLVREGASGAAIIEYRWYECVTGSNAGTKYPWVVY